MKVLIIIWLSNFIDLLFYVMYFSIILVIIRSWINFSIPRSMAKIWYFIEDLADWYLGFFRKYIPPLMAGGLALDLSPILGILILELVHSFLKELIWSL